jgi:glyoxylase-like metal-dependent hydrolase (beta-lactamase superfamily II)
MTALGARRFPDLPDGAPELSLYPIHLGSLDVPERQLREGGADTPVTVPLMAALVKRPDGRAALIDNGMDDDVLTRLKVRHAIPAGALKTGLAMHDLNFDDIDVVINTHLHCDHAGMNKVFTRARIVAQRAEYAFAHDAPGDHAYAYRPRSSYWDIPADRFDLVAGHCEVFPGLHVVHTPGHTPGHQSVAVNTKSGWLIYTGDACDDTAIWERRHYPGILFDRAEFDASLEALRSSGCTPVFPHDPEFNAMRLAPVY